MKKKLLPLLLTLSVYSTYSQVGIGTKIPNSSAQLEILSTEKGVLIPQVSLTGSNDRTTIKNGNINSLLVFNTSVIADVTPGYYYWYIDKWQRIALSDEVATGKDGLDGKGIIKTTIDATGNLIITYSDGIMANIGKVRGDTGPQGIAGVEGATGPQGPTGSTGTTGLQGPMGPTGPAGIQGLPGVDGAVGPQGPAGATGPTGIQGLPGVDGAVGPQGPAGATGPQGPMGATGATGPAGIQGLPGVDGAVGPQGPAGATGPQGLTGLQGLAGIDGAVGPQGPVGATGPAGPAGGTTNPTILPNYSIGHVVSNGSITMYTTPFTATTNTTASISTSFLVPGNTTFTINFYSYDDEALTYELWKVTPSASSTTYSTTGAVLATVNTGVYSGSGVATNASFSYTAASGELFTIKIYKTSGGAITSSGSFYSMFSAI